MLRQQLPETTAFDKKMFDFGPLHQIANGVVASDVTQEMFTELAIMNRCSALIYMDSGFSILLRTKLDDANALRLRPSFTRRAVMKLAASI